MPYFPEDRRTGPSPFRRKDTLLDAADPVIPDSGVKERNGIWVARVAGTWLGDYTRREHALAAVRAASHGTG